MTLHADLPVNKKKLNVSCALAAEVSFTLNACTESFHSKKFK